MSMMKFLLFIFGGIGLNLVFADTKVPSLNNNPSFEKIQANDTFLCVGEKSTGFDWVGDKWEPRNFKPAKWIIRKMPKNHEYCLLNNEMDQEFIVGDLRISNLRRCYSIKSFGDKDKLGNLINTAVCYESYRGDTSDGVAVQCADNIIEKFAFSPNGSFILISGNPRIPPKNTKQDSFFTETGICSPM